MRTPVLLSVLGAGLLLQACGSAPPPATATPAAAAPVNGNRQDMNEPDAPKWIRTGCGAFFGEKKTLVCGVGRVAGISDPGLAQSAAEGRGRTAIARSLSLRVKAMLKSYQASTSGGPGNKENPEQYVEDTSKQITNMTLVGTRVADSWVSSRGTFFSLVVLDAEAFKTSMKSMAQLDEQLRAAIVDRANNAFGELDKETEGPLPPLEDAGAAN